MEDSLNIWHKDDRSYQSCTGSINEHLIGLSSLLCTGGKTAQRKGMLPSRSLGLSMVIKAFATGNPDDETLPEVYCLPWWSHLCHLRDAQCYLRQWKPPETSLCTGHIWSLALIASGVVHPSFPSGTSPVARGLLCCSIWECRAEALSLLCLEWFPCWHPAYWKAADLKHREVKRGESTRVWGRGLTGMWRTGAGKNAVKGAKRKLKSWNGQSIVQHGSYSNVPFPVVEVISLCTILWCTVETCLWRLS